MARKAFILAIWILAVSLGILGYQCLTFYFYQHWPPVSLAFAWQEVVGAWRLLFDIHPGTPHDDLNWFSRLPVVPVGIIVSYVVFLLSDMLRGRAARLPA